MVFNDEKIINFDAEGWPLEKKTLRDILKTVGFKDNPETGKFEIDSSMDILECFPMTLEDDGMGYGTNEHYITDSYIFNEGHDMNMYIDKELEGIKYFVEDNVSAYTTFQYNGDDVYLFAFDEKTNCYIARKENVPGDHISISIPRQEIKDLFKVGI